MGSKKINSYKAKSHGEPVYEKGNTQITLDRDGHNGGFWKMINKRTGERMGTYSKDLKIRIGN